MTSTNDCGNHAGGGRRRKKRDIVCGTVIVVVFLVLLAILLIWAILRPTKPNFVLQDATVYAFTVSSPSSPAAPYYLLNATLGITLSSRNPNRRIGIYYDRLHVYATYRNQEVTLRTRIDGPGWYQGHKSTDVWSPLLYSPSVPVAPYNGVTLSQEYQSAGTAPFTVKLNGRIRWRVGSFISTTYHLHVACPADISLAAAPSSSSSSSSASVAKYQLSQKCKVNV